MKLCQKCNIQQSDYYNYCTQCNSPLTDSRVPGYSSNSPNQATAQLSGMTDSMQNHQIPGGIPDDGGSKGDNFPDPQPHRPVLEESSKNPIANIALLMIVIGICGFYASTLFPWYVWEWDLENQEDGSTSQLTVNEYLEYEESELILTTGDGNLSDTEMHQDNWYYDGEYRFVFDETDAIYLHTTFMLFVSIALACGSLVLVVLHYGKLLKPSKVGLIGGVLATATGIFMIISIILVMQNLPAAHEDSYKTIHEDYPGMAGPWESYWSQESSKIVTKEGTIEYDSSWRPATGSFFAIGGGLFMMAGGIGYILGTRKRNPIDPGRLTPSSIGP